MRAVKQTTSVRMAWLQRWQQGGWCQGGAKAESLPSRAPNIALEPTANSLRSCVAPAIGGGSPLALGAKGAGGNTAAVSSQAKRPSPSARASRQDREPHPTRDGAPPACAGAPQRGVCTSTPRAGRARGQATRPPRHTLGWVAGPPQPGVRVASPCRRSGWCHPRCGAWRRTSALHLGVAMCAGRRSGWPVWVAPSGTRWVAGGRGTRGSVQPNPAPTRGGRVRPGSGLPRRGHGVLGRSWE